MKKILSFFLFLLLLACSAEQAQTRAHITQRSTGKAGRLMISYEFRVGDSLFSDSMELANRVVPHDSVTVLFSPANPRKSHLSLP
ncbi:MAG: hypothetical protein EPO58_17505 [Chitinophagaceae bacterium]|nr:hypothetical protein [Bacteroidota bacterium]TAJ44440.1 MAG: hypothetical protein EPO58_17505 [Chitinophagaceae bacterium]